MPLATNIDPRRDEALARLATITAIAETLPATINGVSLAEREPYMLLIAHDPAEITAVLGVSGYRQQRFNSTGSEVAWLVWRVDGITVLMPTEPRERPSCDGFATGTPCLDCPACDERQGVEA